MNASLPELETSRWYADKVRRFGYDHRGLGFRTRSAQEKRFEALLALGDFHGRSLLDVGCGFGDFLAFMRDRDIHPRYTGIDLCEPMITRCRDRFPVSDGIFKVSDVLAYRPEEPFDFVVASGIFGLDAAGTRERIEPTLRRLLEWSRVGAAVNFLSTRAPSKVDARVYVEPADMLHMALALTPAVRLDHGYLPNDFTLHLYRTPAWATPEGTTP